MSASPARPVDILALQESVYYSGTGINPTAQSFVNVLNSLYGTAANPTPYAAASLNGKTDGNNIGNGPQTLIYNTTTVTLLNQAALGTPGSTTLARQVMEYQFQPVGSSSSFYLFNDHFKSGTGTTNEQRRGAEGTIVANAASALPAGSSIIYAGDYNPTLNASDPGYVNVTSAANNANHGIDPLAGNFNSAIDLTTSPATTAAFANQSTTGMKYRDDLLLNSPAVESGNTGTLSLINGSYSAFGNTGTVAYGGAITTGNASLFANELTAGNYSTSQASAILTDLSQVSDHLPVIADYQLNNLNSVPEPTSMVLILAGAAGIFGYAHRKTARGTIAKS